MEMTTGEKIKRIRKEKKLTQRELGIKLGGVSQQQIGQWENGQSNPKYETLKKIANALEVPISFLTEYTFWENRNDYIPTEWLNDKDYKPILDVLEKEYQMNLVSDKEIMLPLEDACKQVYQNRLLSSFNKLNDMGREEAIKRVEELTEIPRYKKPDEN